MRIAVCDDCKGDILYLQSLLEGYDAAFYSQGEKLLADIADHHMCYDLYLIGISPDSVNGLGLARQIREKDEDAAICFASSSDAFYREAYDLYAIQYLLKPVREEALQEVIERVEHQMGRWTEPTLHFKWRSKIGSIPYDQILFVSSREHKLYIYCKDGTIQECMGKLDETAAQICGAAFLRVHQSFVVNMYCVESLSGSELAIGGYRIPISRRYYLKARKRYQEILFEERK